jgi:hypothetical protein
MVYDAIDYNLDDFDGHNIGDEKTLTLGENLKEDPFNMITQNVEYTDYLT